MTMCRPTTLRLALAASLLLPPLLDAAFVRRKLPPCASIDQKSATCGASGGSTRDTCCAGLDCDFASGQCVASSGPSATPSPTSSPTPAPAGTSVGCLPNQTCACDHDPAASCATDAECDRTESTWKCTKTPFGTCAADADCEGNGSKCKEAIESVLGSCVGSGTAGPTGSPTEVPTGAPSSSPTEAPTGAPTKAPTGAPSPSPTKNPTAGPTASPSSGPTRSPNPEPACTAEGLDPYAPGASQTCCTGLEMCLGDWVGGGSPWSYLCLTTCPTDAPTPAPVPAPVCTAEGLDPYATGTLQTCCAGLQMCNDDWDGNGLWSYRCFPSCSSCYCTTCIQSILDTIACNGSECYSCGSRMQWLRDTAGQSEAQSCTQVANEFPNECGACNSQTCAEEPYNYVSPDPANLVWSDEFDVDGLPDSTKWGYDWGGHGWGNNELQFYTNDTSNNAHDNAYVSAGTLKVRAVREDYGGNGYTSARLVTRGKGDWTYGRVIVRARLAECTGLGTWPAIWMLPTDWVYPTPDTGTWPDSGEIDIMEHVGYNTGNIHGSIHTKAYNHMDGSQRGGGLWTNVADWHNYEIIWTSNSVQFIFDGNKYFEFANDGTGDYTTWPFDKRFHLILNVAVGGSWGGLGGIDESAFVGNGQIMEVDWVRVYSS